jgi:hypothetical protein
MFSNNIRNRTCTGNTTDLQSDLYNTKPWVCGQFQRLWESMGILKRKTPPYRQLQDHDKHDLSPDVQIQPIQPHDLVLYLCCLDPQKIPDMAANVLMGFVMMTSAEKDP